MNLLELGDGEKISKADYLRLASTCREKLMSPTYFDPTFDIDHELGTNPDTKTTYQSYFSRISEDLKWAKGFDPLVATDPTLYATEVSQMAKTMINRLIVSSIAVIYLGGFFFLVFLKYDSMAHYFLRHMKPSSTPHLENTSVSRFTLRWGETRSLFPYCGKVTCLVICRGMQVWWYFQMERLRPEGPENFVNCTRLL